MVCCHSDISFVEMHIFFSVLAIAYIHFQNVNSIV
jgi:hypothetical protein